MARMIVTLVLALALLACRDKLHIEKIAEPEYPLRARYEKLQGTVTVRVEIGPDGKVTFAEGSGAPEVLVKAAEENARQWVFGPFPAVNEFPIHHTIQYIYKLEGEPKVAAFYPTVKTFLPDRIEVSAGPLISDYPSLEQYKPIPKAKKQ